MDALSMPTTSTDFMGVDGIDGSFGSGVSSYGMDLGGYGMSLDMSSMGISMAGIDDPSQSRGIDPQLVDTPSAISDHGDEESDEKDSPVTPAAETKEPEKATITIAPVKVGGHGKARKGTVQSGGIVKKTASSTTPLTVNKEKENATSTFTALSKKTAPLKFAKPAAPSTSGLFQTTTPSPFLASGDNSSKAGSEAGDQDDDDDLPQDWRPSPEVFAKMTSKEKRQLRNKISARNFRVRRKEYISTLEGDIAERDKMLDHFRTQLGSRESENLALRQEIAALKKALLDGRGGAVNLPPPAPLPEQSAAEALAASASSNATNASSPLLTANTQKDLPSSPRMGNGFWGGVGMGGGVTPVHTTLVPDISTIVRKGLQENINPSLNAQVNLGGALGGNKPALNGFDGFADLNPFTMKTLDAYRMHLWGKMAAQQHMHNQSQAPQNFSPQPSGLAASMRPHFFTGAPSSKPNLPVPGSTLSAILSGKHSASTPGGSPYLTPPASPLLNHKPLFNPKEREMQQQREKEQQQAILAAMASQTILRKLGSAFWDAFTGSSSSSTSPISSASASPTYFGAWDSDKVQRVLEGKAVLRVVDVEPVTPPASPKIRAVSSVGMGVGVSSRMPNSPLVQQEEKKHRCGQAMCDILEESMRSLTLSKKA